MSLDALLTKLGDHPLPTIALGLERIEEALRRLGEPQRSLPPVVHVAGTNGKGSTIAFMRAILEAAGLRVHVYTSPHLVRFNERIVLAGAEIEDAPLTELLEEVIRKTEGMHLTFFESTTAAAFLAFSRTPADVLLLEVGLGGRLDATNVIARPALTIITPVSYDHMDYLGETLTKIAAEKAGILKPNVPCIVAEQSAEAMAVFEELARLQHTPLHRFGHEWHLQKTAEIQLAGAHQRMNASTAAEAMKHLGMFHISTSNITAGLKQARWPARLQNITWQGLPEGVEIYLDGGHNVAGAEALAAWMREQSVPVHVILGMLKGKQALQCATILSHAAASLTLTAIKGETRALSPDMLARQLHRIGQEASVLHDWRMAVEAALTRHSPPFIIMIAGSLYLAGDVLKNID